jgi:hypothetical protein
MVRSNFNEIIILLLRPLPQTREAINKRKMLWCKVMWMVILILCTFINPSYFRFEILLSVIDIYRERNVIALRPTRFHDIALLMRRMKLSQWVRGKSVN